MGWFDMAHQAVAIGEAADDAALYQCAHQVEREEDVEIALGVAVIVVAVGDGQIAQWGCGRNGAVGRVATGIGHVERWLIPQMYPAGRDQVSSRAACRGLRNGVNGISSKLSTWYALPHSRASAGICEKICPVRQYNSLSECLR